MKYDANLTLREARDQYLKHNGFDYEFKRWVRIQAWPMSYYIPNTRARHEAVLVHDLHHVLTGFGTDITGEAEIGAWEIASGIPFRYTYGVMLDGMGAFFGLFHHPRRIVRAFAWGWQCRNLYGEYMGDRAKYEKFLDERVEDVRNRILKKIA